MRAFCCTVLLQAAAAPEHTDGFDGEIETIIQLVASVLVLGSDASAAALSLLCWRMLTLPREHDERPFFLLAILLLATSLFHAEADGPLLQQLGEWVMAEEAEVRVQLPPSRVREAKPWLLGLTTNAIKHDTWRTVAARVLLDPASAHPSVAAPTLRGIGARLVGDTI
jgi:hypothetical protein